MRSISKQAKDTRKSILSSKEELDDTNVLEEGQLYGTGIAD